MSLGKNFEDDRVREPRDKRLIFDDVPLSLGQFRGPWWRAYGRFILAKLVAMRVSFAAQVE